MASCDLIYTRLAGIHDFFAGSPSLCVPCAEMVRTLQRAKRVDGRVRQCQGHIEEPTTASTAQPADVVRSLGQRPGMPALALKASSRNVRDARLLRRHLQIEKRKFARLVRAIAHQEFGFSPFLQFFLQGFCPE